MNEYIFRTHATMKPYNSRYWWIDSDIITEKRISAESVAAALEQYREQVEEKHYITISRNAIRTKSAMYQDKANGEPKQIGYVITGKSEFQRDSGAWVTQYIDLWVEILTVCPTNFEEV